MGPVMMTFPQGKYKVLTMSYDDGKISDRKLVGIFNKYGIKGSFHINSGLFTDASRIPASEVAELYRGHEVSAHTFRHPTIARCPDEQIVDEIIKDREGLELLVNYPVRGLSYPNGSFDSRIKNMLPFLGIEYARTVHNTGTFAMPDDFVEWNPTTHHNRNLMELATQFLQLYKQQYLYMFYVWGHSYEFDNDDNWGLIEEFCKVMSGNSDIWYATNIEIVNYMKAFGNLKFSASRNFVHNPAAISVWLNVGGEIIEARPGVTTSLC